MTSRFNQTTNVAYKRTSKAKVCSNRSEKRGEEFSTGTLGKFHPALTPWGKRQYWTDCLAPPRCSLKPINPLRYK